MPQKATLFARRSDAGSPKMSRGAFLLLERDASTGEILERVRFPAIPNCALWRDCHPIVMGSHDLRTEWLFHSGGPAGVSGGHRRGGPHRADSSASAAHRFSRAKSDGDGVRARIRGSSGRGHGLL